MIEKSSKTGPATEARTSAAVLAKIIGGTAENAGRRCMVFTRSSQKLSKIEGSVECRGSTVTLSLVDISAPEAGAMLATLVFMRGESKKRKAKR
jgi:hypothetical protein